MNLILTQAVRDARPTSTSSRRTTRVRIRYRVDGALHEVLTLPVNGAALVSRIKVMADMNIVERRRPQDGQFEVEVDGRALDVRVATTATIWGEKACCGSSTRAGRCYELDRLGMPPETARRFLEADPLAVRHGDLRRPDRERQDHHALRHAQRDQRPERNIMTIEDPVEYVFPTINQIQINEPAGITFAGGLQVDPAPGPGRDPRRRDP